MKFIPNRRARLKWIHWLSFALILYFFLVEPEENKADPAAALSTHSGIGLLLAVLTVIWFAMYLSKGLASRPGPKLPNWARKAHPLLHKALQFGVPVMLASGALAALAAPFVIQAFGVIPLDPGIGSKTLHELAYDLHELIFDALIILIVAHAVFHLWRHYLIRDNALRIMAPKFLHKYL